VPGFILIAVASAFKETLWVKSSKEIMGEFLDLEPIVPRGFITTRKLGIPRSEYRYLLSKESGFEE
jgi:hypothetical protein